MKLVWNSLLQSVANIALVTSVSADPVTLQQHPLESAANISERAVGLAAGTVDVARSSVRKVGRTMARPFVDSKYGPAPAEIKCETADIDLETLGEERATKARQLHRGVKSVVPGIAASRIMQGVYTQEEKVDTAQYVYDIDQHVSEIRATCNIESK